ncbi:cation diffusion facilitator family transporter [bacterium]|nr:MAG: cation diffusion facilitator family transporter [bacterium]
MERQKFNFYTRMKSWFRTDSPVFTTRISLLLTIFISIFGISLGVIEDSLAVKTNGIISALDILNSFLFLNAVNMSVRNPDYIFNYGYGKYESISILGSSILLLLVLGYTSIEAISNFGKTGIGNSNYTILMIFSTVSFILMRYVYKVQKKSSRKYKMPILEYDALLWKTDSYIEIFVLINLVVGLLLQILGYRYIGLIVDSGVAILLTVLALKVPLKGSMDALNQLMDRTVSDDVQMRLLSVVTRNHKNICEFKAIHTRQSGKDIFVELDIILPYDETMKYKDDLEKKIANEIKAINPNTVPRVYAIACDGICLVENQRNCPIHKFRSLNE